MPEERTIVPEKIINPGRLDRLTENVSNLSESDADAFVNEMTEPEKPVPPRDETGKFTRSAPEAPDQESSQEDIAPEAASDDVAEPEPVDNNEAIDPPASWTAEAKEQFAKLTPELQRYVTQRESEREKGISQKLSESTAAQKAAEAAVQAAQVERQQFQQVLQASFQYMTQLDPILAEGQKIDWAAESLRDPAGTQTKWFEYQKRAQVANAMQQKVMEMTQQVNQDRLRNYVQQLATAMPDFVDPVKGPEIRNSYTPVLKAVGYTDAEIAQGWGVPRDVREMKVLDMAAKGFALEKAKQTIADKRVAPQAPKVGKPAQPQTPQTRQAQLEKRLTDSLKHAPGTKKGLSNDKYVDTLTQLLTTKPRATR